LVVSGPEVTAAPDVAAGPEVASAPGVAAGPELAAGAQRASSPDAAPAGNGNLEARITALEEEVARLRAQLSELLD
jgi:uncharacterized protein YceH (UPF0502 family)